MSWMFSMDQYADFVWAAYGVSAIGIAGIVVWCLRSYSLARARLQELEKNAP
ncbi:MAG TPA: heme exporter protein CcmD [Rhizomicrobium sp.]|nr:heme exporter protein CcmD [Rhizomicrobium sp.]